MAQALLKAANTHMVQSGDMTAQDLAERVGALQLEETDLETDSDSASEFDSNTDSDSDTERSVTFELPDGYRKFHHSNFFGNPVYAKCATSPAVSLTILMSDRRDLVDVDKDFRKAILLWDALALIDPVAYWGPHDVLEKLRGTALREAVNGQCGKIYTHDGTWLQDKFGEDEDQPLNYDDTVKTDILFNGERCPYKLAPSADQFIDLLDPRKENSVNVVALFLGSREQSRVRPHSRLREVTSAAECS